MIDWQRVGDVYASRRRGGSRGIRYVVIFEGIPRFDETKRRALGTDHLLKYANIYYKRRALSMTDRIVSATIRGWQERMV